MRPTDPLSRKTLGLTRTAVIPSPLPRDPTATLPRVSPRVFRDRGGENLPFRRMYLWVALLLERRNMPYAPLMLWIIRVRLSWDNFHTCSEPLRTALSSTVSLLSESGTTHWRLVQNMYGNCPRTISL
jgi:hypothetical protein